MLSLKAFLGLDASGFSLGIKRAESAATNFERKIRTGIGARLQAFLTVAAATAAVKSVLTLGSTISDLSARTDVSTDAIQKWMFAMSQTGGKGEDAIAFFERLATTRDEALKGNKKLIEAFQKLGVSISDLRTMRVEDIGLIIARTVRTGDAQKLISSLREIGGKGAGALVAAFKNGMEGLFNEAPIISPRDLENLDKAEDAIDRMILSLKVGLAPVIVKITNSIAEMVALLKIAAVVMAAPSGLFKGKGPSQIKSESTKEIAAILADFAKDNMRRTGPIKFGGGSDAGKSGSEIAPDGFWTMSNDEKKKEKDNMGAGIALSNLQQIGAKVGYNPFLAEQQKQTRILTSIDYGIKAESNKAKLRPPTAGTTEMNTGGVTF